MIQGSPTADHHWHLDERFRPDESKEMDWLINEELVMVGVDVKVGY